MPFTVQQLENISNALFHHHMKGPAMSQTIQDKPMLARLKRKQKKFGGGRGQIILNVKGDYTTQMEGYSHDDIVTYRNPANIRQAKYDWREVHAGIQMTNTELKHAGISVTDTMAGESVSNHSEKELVEITNLYTDKLEDMTEGFARDMNEMCWLDGSQDSKQAVGITGYITDNPTTGVIAGLDRATNTWWRNRALTGGNKITHSTSSQTLTKTLRAEVRQLRRYGGRPNLIVAGSRAIERLENEIHEKGTYTQQGFAKGGPTDIGLPAISMYGVGEVMYDPTLDDLGREEFIYVLDDTKFMLMVMDGEDMKEHSPARPHDQYVLFRAVTWTGCMVFKQMNCHGVYETA